MLSRSRAGRARWIALAAVSMLFVGDRGLAQDAVTRSNPDPGRGPTLWLTVGAQEITPMPLVSRSGTPVAPASFAPSGPPGWVVGVTPGTEKAARPSIVQGTSIEQPIFGGTEWYSYPPPHTRYFPRFGLSFYPHSTLGKLFFTDGATNFVCSAAAMVCGGQNLVMTAGHCCAAGDGVTWYDDFLFVPSCFGANCNVGGSAPFGRWDWETTTVSTSWFNFGDLSSDVCFIETAPLGGQELHSVTGSLGFAWNQAQPVHYTMTGWPAASPFSGDTLVFEVGSTADLDGSVSPATVGVGNFMTGGSSGGAWIKDYKQGATATNQFWNGLNSYKYVSPARPAEMYGPYIDTSVFNIWSGFMGCQ